jgi:hypothetical protein
MQVSQLEAVASTVGERRSITRTLRNKSDWSTHKSEFSTKFKILHYFSAHDPPQRSAMLPKVRCSASGEHSSGTAETLGGSGSVARRDQTRNETLKHMILKH